MPTRSLVRSIISVIRSEGKENAHEDGTTDMISADGPEHEVSGGTRASTMGLRKKTDVSCQEEAYWSLIARTLKTRLGSRRNSVRKVPIRSWFPIL